jgi:hypothetical protein
VSHGIRWQKASCLHRYVGVYLKAYKC